MKRFKIKRADLIILTTSINNTNYSFSCKGNESIQQVINEFLNKYPINTSFVAIINNINTQEFKEVYITKKGIYYAKWGKEFLKNRIKM